MNEQNPDTRRGLETVADNRDAALAVAREARRSLVLLSWDLEPPIYATPDFLDTVRALATSSRFARIRILVQDPTRVIRQGHRLVELARRLSSFIEIRRPHPEHRDLPESFLVADERAVLYRTLASRPEGVVDLHDPVLARDKLRLFDSLWEKAETEPELRRLGI